MIPSTFPSSPLTLFSQSLEQATVSVMMGASNSTSFLDLPAEIRAIIYGYAFASPPLDLSSLIDITASGPTALL